MQYVDTRFLQFTIDKTLQKSASVHLLFGFEYVILASTVVSVFLKYSLSLADTYFEGRWENKVSWMPGSESMSRCKRYHTALYSAIGSSL